MHNFRCIVVVFLFGLINHDMVAQSNFNQDLTIETAIKKALMYNPEIQAQLKNIDASRALKIQSGLSPNPELGIDAENILGSDGFSGLRGSEMTIGLSQSILLAGKLSKRENVAKMDISLAEWDYETKRLEVITNIRKTFASALATRKLINKNNELFKISEELILNLGQRVKAGKISMAEVSRAKIILNSLQIDIFRLKSDYEAAIFELISIINDPNLSFVSPKGELKNIENLPDYDSLYVKLENNPNLQKFASEFDKQKAVIIYEESKSTPDLTVSAGYRRLNEVNTNTFVVGVSIPLPIFDRNQGSIQEAQIRLDQKLKEYEAIKNRLTLHLNLLYNRLTTLLISAEKLEKESIPNAEETFRIIKEGNLLGRFTIIDVLDTQRTLFQIQNQYLNIVSETNAVIVELEGLIVTNIN